MSRYLHETANAVLYRALDLPAGDRQQFIAQATAGDSELFDDVRAMLSRIEQLDQFLEDPLELPSEPPAPPPALPVRGELVGRWRVEHELGRNGADLILLVHDSGGAGTATGTMRLAQAASRSGQTSARFERLRERLATLDHPAIPAPIDSGETIDGRPYFVIGRGAGLAIDAYCAGHALDLPARAALFVRVCHAVHYLHQHLIVHRDLKPADMLVDDQRQIDGAPAITLLDAGMIGDGWPLHPAYASPDQLAGQPLSVASDIYSLGAVLYGLVSGQLPHGDHGALGAHQRPAVPAPSAAVRAAMDSGAGMAADLASDPLLAPSSELSEILRQHFDAVLLKALASDPADRYASAHALAHDLALSMAAWQAAAAMPAVAPAPESVAGASAQEQSPLAAAPALAPLPVPAAPRRSATGVALAMLLAGLVAGAAGAIYGLPYLQQGASPSASHSGAGSALPRAAVKVGGSATPARKPAPAAALDAAIDPAIALQLSSAPPGQRAALARQAAAWQAALSDARRGAGDLDGAVQSAGQAAALAPLVPEGQREDARAQAQWRLGAALAAQGHSEQGLAALRDALALQQARTDKGAPQLGADIDVAIAEALAASGDDAGAEAALNQARSLYAAAIERAQGEHDDALLTTLQAKLLTAELARARAQNAQKHGRDTVATLAGLHRLAGADADPRLALLEAYVQPRGTPAQAYAAALPALEKLKAANNDAGDMGEQRDTALATLMTAEIGLRAQQKAAACAQVEEAQRLFDGLAAAHRASAYDQPALARLARARGACN